MDDRKQRLLVDADGGEGIGCMGWEVADAAALDALGARLEAAGIKVARGSHALAAERHVRDLIVLHDPAGNRLEFFHGAESTPEPFVPGRNISGFRTGPLGMGHVVLHVDNIDNVLPFYRELLGFQLSDYWMRPFRGYFMNVNQRHHSLAFIETGRNAAHHMMIGFYRASTMSAKATTLPKPRPGALRSRSAAIRATTSRPSMRGTPRAS